MSSRLRFFSALMSIVMFLMSFAAQAGWIRIVGDIEGLEKRWEQLVREGVIKIESDGSVTLAPGYSISFEGDLMKRGPFGRETIDRILSMMRRYNTDPNNQRVRLVLGNHDLNTLSLIQWLPIMELGEAPDFEKWLVQKQRKNDFVARVDYWAEYNGVNDKIAWFWLKEVARKLNKSPVDPWIKGEFYPDGKPNIERLAQHLSKEQAYKRFFEYVKPGGTLWKLYARANVIQAFETSGKIRFLSFHSGILTTGNFGIVPGEADGLFERAVREEFKDKAEYILQAHDFSKIEVIEKFEKSHPGFTWRAIQLWTQRYNEYVNNQLNEIDGLFSELKGKSGYKGLEKSNEALSRANRLYTNRMAALGDAGWDPIAGKINIDANSLVYPDSRVVKGSSIPGLPENFIVKILGLANIDYITGGHQPVGDGMIHRTARYRKNIVQFLLTDTSFSPVEQEDMLRVSDEGALQFKTITRDGLDIMIERPSKADLDKMTELVRRWHALSSEKRKQAAPETQAYYKNLESRIQAYDRLGMLANGWLIVGFAKKIDEKGQVVPDYENYILFQKIGYKMIYKTVDIWGVTSSDVKLEYAVTDLSEMAEKAHQDKIKELQMHGKDVLSMRDFLRALEGRKVMVLSGPALNSLTKALVSEDAKKVLENYKAQFRAWLTNMPESEKWTFIVGGTQGLESELSKIISEVNEKRQNPLEIIGVVAGVSGGAELDKSVKKYLPLRKAFYWDDYFTELLPLLTKTKTFKPSELHFAFAGGGAIVGKQIREVLAAIESGARASLSLIEGLSAGFTNSKDISATDQFLRSDLGKSVIAKNKLVQVIKTQANRASPVGEKKASAFVDMVKSIVPGTNGAIKCELVFQ